MCDLNKKQCLMGNKASCLLLLKNKDYGCVKNCREWHGLCAHSPSFCMIQPKNCAFQQSPYYKWFILGICTFVGIVILFIGHLIVQRLCMKDVIFSNLDAEKIKTNELSENTPASFAKRVFSGSQTVKSEQSNPQYVDSDYFDSNALFIEIDPHKRTAEEEFPVIL